MEYAGLEPMIEVMVNTKMCGGGIRYSKLAVELYERRTNKSVTFSASKVIDRDDPVMVAIVKELGPEANGMYTKIQLWSIPETYKNYYAVREEDGTEYLGIYYKDYKLEMIKHIIKETDYDCDRKNALILAIIAEAEIRDIPGII